MPHSAAQGGGVASKRSPSAQSYLVGEKILAVASGEKTKSELNGVGEEEFAPWGIGPTL